MGQSFTLHGQRPFGALSGEVEKSIGELNLAWHEQTLVASASRAALPSAIEVESQVNDDDVLTVTFSDGFKLLMRGDQYRRIFVDLGLGAGGGQMPPSSLRIPVPTQLPSAFVSANESRSVTATIVSIVVAKLAEAVASYVARAAGQKTAELICRWYEGVTIKGEDSGRTGLFVSCGEIHEAGEIVGLTTSPMSADVEIGDVSRPTLLLIHGTASNTQQAFGTLWKQHPNAIEKLKTAYGEIIAFDHKTLTVSPIQNALDIVRQLKKGSRLHLVTHSRGGLIGELLCRAGRVAKTGEPLDPFDSDDFKLAKKGGFYKDLKSLAKELRDKEIKVERFVRVACPALGTSLASERLDLWLSVFLQGLDDLLGFVPEMPDGFEQFAEFAKALLASRRDADALPGLAAMTPSSQLIAMLNRDDVYTTSDLSALAGQTKDVAHPWSVLEKLCNRFFDGPNDLIVDTDSMIGGAERVEVQGMPAEPSQKGRRESESTSQSSRRTVKEKQGRYYQEVGPKVWHCRYFVNESSVTQIVQRLTERDQGTLTNAFNLIEADGSDETERSAGVRFFSFHRTLPIADEVKGTRPIVVVLPGIMGSELSVKNDPVWARTMKLMFGGLKTLSNTTASAGVTADNLLAAPYADLCQYLSQSHDVVRFPYDWRLSIKAATSKLRDRLLPILDIAEKHNQPVRFVAHSMGGLVLTGLLAWEIGVWNRIQKHDDSRAVLLGTPLEGSWGIVQMLADSEGLLKKLATLDITSSYEELREIVRQFPGVLELLPAQRVLDLRSERAGNTWGSGSPLDPKAWAHWANELPDIVSPDPKLLRAARQVREHLESVAWRDQRICYVSGRADRTPSGVRIQPDENGQPKMYVTFSGNGDGRVLWDLDALNGVTRWYMDADHGEMASHEASFSAILDLLQSGRTTQLPQSRSAMSRGSRSVGGNGNGGSNSGGDNNNGGGGGGDEIIPPSGNLGGEVLFANRDSLAMAAVGSDRRPQRRSLKGRQRLIRVGVVHGDLSFARFPVVVGHYDGDPLVGPERKLDFAFEQRLTHRQSWGMYAGDIGTSTIIISDQPAQRPQGVIVVGLGRAGELTAASLRQSFRSAVLEFATLAAEFEDGRLDDPVSGFRLISVSALLIGTSSDGLAIPEAVEAMLRAVADVSDRLRKNKGEHYGKKALPLEIGEIEFVEVYDDQAGTADRCLKKLLERQPFASNFAYEAIQTRAGCQERQLSSESPGWWHRLQITNIRGGRLKFDMLTRRARTETQEIQTQAAALELLIREATATTVTRVEICKTLFQILLPNALKDAAIWNNYLQLIVDSKSAAFPWEMLWDRSREHSQLESEQPPVVTAGIIRQLKTTNFRSNPVEELGKFACVIGDPVGSDSKPIEGFAPLEGAVSEANQVSRVLHQNGYQVREVIRQSVVEVFTALHDRGYRILHLAGHGVHEFSNAQADIDFCQLGLSAEFLSCFFKCREKTTDKPVSGMVLGRHSKRLVVLGAADVDQMPTVPELVFINCCELGRTKSGTEADVVRLKNPPAFAANIAEQFIRMGVRCVIAAGWEIADAPAATFASAFYQAFLRGETFGNAVRFAREQTWKEYPSFNTWGAYQCYGDPGWRLVSPRDRSLTGPQRGSLPDWNTPHEAIVGLRNILEEAKAITPSLVGELITRLNQIREELESESTRWVGWWHRADVVGQLAIAYSEVGDFETAILLLRHSLSRNNGHPPPALAQERLCDATNRVALQIVTDRHVAERARRIFSRGIASSDSELARYLLDENQRRLSGLLSLAENSELYQLLSSKWRRKACLEVAIDYRVAALKSAIIASHAARRLWKKEARFTVRGPQHHWDNQSWPEYILLTLRTVMDILKADTRDVRSDWHEATPLTSSPVPDELASLIFEISQGSLPDDDELKKPFAPQFTLAWCDENQARARAKAAKKPNFWSSTWQAGCDLLRLLLQITLKIDDPNLRDDQVRYAIERLTEDVRQGYELAGWQGASGRERSSIIQHLLWLSMILKTDAPRNPLVELVRSNLGGIARDLRDKWLQ